MESVERNRLQKTVLETNTPRQIEFASPVVQSRHRPLYVAPFKREPPTHLLSAITSHLRRVFIKEYLSPLPQQ